MESAPTPSVSRQPPLTVTINQSAGADTAAASRHASSTNSNTTTRGGGGGSSGGLLARALGALRARLPWRGERARLDERYLRLRCALGLTADELWGLHRAFTACNASHSGAASLPELLAFLDLDRSFLTERVYNLYRDGGAGIGFQAWVLATWNLCSRDADGLAFFAFNVYDLYGRGWLGLLEVGNLLREVYGEGYEGKHTARTTLRKLCRVDVRGRPVGARVGFRRFLGVTRYAGVLLFPAFELQRVLQERTGGVGAWEALTRRRAAGVSDGSLDIRAITRVANEGRPKRRSVVAVSEAHFLPVSAALADGGANELPEGLRGVAAARQRRASAAAPLLQLGSASDYVPGGRRRGGDGGGELDEDGDDYDAAAAAAAGVAPRVDPTTGALVMPAIDVDGVEDADAADAQEADAAATRAAMGLTATSRRLSLRAAASVRYGGLGVGRGSSSGNGGGAGGRRLARGSVGVGRASAPPTYGGGGDNGNHLWDDDDGAALPPPDAATYTAHDSRASAVGAVAEAAAGSGSSSSVGGSGGGSASSSGSDVSTTGAMARLARQLPHPHLAGPVRAATTAPSQAAAPSPDVAALARRLARVGATRRGNNTGAAAMRAAARSARGQA